MTHFFVVACRIIKNVVRHFDCIVLRTVEENILRKTGNNDNVTNYPTCKVTNYPTYFAHIFDEV